MYIESKLYKLAKILVLATILILALGLRAFNPNFPSIGYHNLNENEYLIAAQEMQRTGNYFADKLYCRNIFQQEKDIFRYQPPLISYQILLSWRFLDENLWGPRLINVLFGVMSVLVLYLIALALFKEETRALSASLLLAIMPLAVFFSRNLQPESPGFFFMVLSNLFYLRFITSFKGRDLFMSGLSLSMACLYSFNFVIALIPYIPSFPLGKYLKDKKNLVKAAFIFFVSLSPLIVEAVWLKNLGQNSLLLLEKVKPLDIFTANYWFEHGRAIWWYAAKENFSIMYVVLALAGIVAAFFKRKGLLNRYLMGWAAALVIYGMLYSKYIFENNFSQMPFLLFVPISTVYAVSLFSGLLKKRFKKQLFLVCMLIIISISIPFLSNSIVRMYGTAFLGADVAGESLREYTSPNERIFLSGHIQGYAILRYSGRMGGWAGDLNDFKEKEKEFGIRYACFYPIDNLFRLKTENAPLFYYIQENYHVKEVGLTEEPPRLYYIILERGKGCDLEASLKSLSGVKQIKTIYKSFDKYVFFYVIRTVAADSGSS